MERYCIIVSTTEGKHKGELVSEVLYNKDGAIEHAKNVFRALQHNAFSNTKVEVMDDRTGDTILELL